MTPQEISEKLNHWHEQAQRLMSLFDAKGQRVPAQDQDTAKALLNSLKDGLKAEYNRLSPVEVQQSLSADESAFYKPAVDEGFLALSKVRRNSTPDVGWFNALDDVLICMRHNQPR